MSELLSACGNECTKCSSFRINCIGCYHLRSVIPEKIEEDMCPIYQCAMNKNEKRSCAGCSDLPCEKYLICVDDGNTIEEIRNDISNRVERLDTLKERIK